MSDQRILSPKYNNFFVGFLHRFTQIVLKFKTLVLESFEFQNNLCKSDKISHQNRSQLATKYVDLTKNNCPFLYRLTCTKKDTENDYKNRLKSLLIFQCERNLLMISRKIKGFWAFQSNFIIFLASLSHACPSQGATWALGPRLDVP